MIPRNLYALHREMTENMQEELIRTEEFRRIALRTLQTLAVGASLILSGTYAVEAVRADPAPIVLGPDGIWRIDRDNPFPEANFRLDLRRFAQLPKQGQSLSRPLGLQTIPGDDRLLVVLERIGNGLVEVAADGSTTSNLFKLNTPGLRTVRDIVFHPDFTNEGAAGFGKLYMLAAAQKPTDIEGKPYLGDPTPDSGDNLVAEFAATFDELGKLNGVDADSYREVLRAAQFLGDHPIGQGGFNPYAEPGDDDYGLLYFAIGDSFEGSVVAQNGQSPLGKTFRIDPLQDGDAPYSVPASNPFVGDPEVFDEIYSLGHRNPHSLSFAKDDQGGMHLLIGDIGENIAEEINLISAGGGNFGWREREGTLLHPDGGEDLGFTYPVAQYGHSGADRHAIAGGYVVDNGSALDGQYVFGDFPTSGELFSFAFEDALGAITVGDPADLTPVEIASVPVLFDDDDDPSTASVPTTVRDIITGEHDYDGSGRLDIRFGQGHGGELYLLNKRNGWMYLVSNSLAPDADFDGVGVVDGIDLAQWEDDFGQNGQSDADRDGDSDGADFVYWQRQFGATSGADARIVPEPKTSLLAAVAAVLGTLALRRHAWRPWQQR